MPFDTTYQVTTGEAHLTYTINKPGGKDTTFYFYLGPGELPSSIDSGLATFDSLFLAAQRPLPEEEATKKSDGPPYSLIVFLLFLGVAAYIRFRHNFRTGNIDNRSLFGDEEENGNAASKKKGYLTYYGDDLNIPDEKINAVLLKRFPYFVALPENRRQLFLHRLKNFMTDKTFKIHSGKGYVEMPILISAAAIQLTFGLKKYLLPHFQYIHIYPQEFMRSEPVLCLLEGNVSGHRINLSWKHFLEGYAETGNGQNVGLHELAHALYYQTFIVEENVDSDFRDQYDQYVSGSNKVYQAERSSEGGLYSKYGESNPQEFWAESAELFFEKPAEMKRTYPDLYDSLKNVLNQDPLDKPSMI